MSIWYAICEALPIEMLQWNFMKNALLAILLMAPLFGLLSTMIVTGRMSFFSDALGHSAFTGIAIGAICGIAAPIWVAVIFSVVFALLFSYVRSRSNQAADTVLILFHLIGFVEQVVAHTEAEQLSCVSVLLCQFDFKFRHRRLVRREHDMFKIEILTCAGKVLYLKALNLNLLNELLIERIQSIQYIDKVVLFGVCCRIVQAEQRIEVLQSFLRNLAAHLLRLVQNDDRSVRFDNVDRTARTELITFGINNTGFLTFAVLFH